MQPGQLERLVSQARQDLPGIPALLALRDLQVLLVWLGQLDLLALQA